MSDTLDTLHLVLSAERGAADLLTLSPSVMAATFEERDRLEQLARAGDKDALNQYDALTEYLRTIVTYRAHKIWGRLSAGQPANMLPAEKTFHDAVATATAALHDAWGIRA